MVTMQAVPAKLGRYRIDGILGEGAMAVVYAGFDPGIERPVAIKCLHREIAADPGYRRRFQVEARAAGHLTHPHIVTIFDVGETPDGRAYIAMEQLPGETLASKVANEGFPSLSIIIDLAGQIAAALDHAHSHGVVHHDIKPENIMLADGWQHAKVNDFGIAERRGPQRDSGGLRTEVSGTPAYMAPEHLRGHPTDARSDLFSLGVVLYWLLCGRLPWSETEDVRKLLEDRQRLPRPPVDLRDPSTPAMLVDIVHTLLEPSAESRYQRGSEVIDDLRLARREQDRQHEKPLATRIISLRVRWAGILGAVLSLTLMIGLAAIYAKQSTAVTGLALDFGSSLARMVASESAEDLLLGDHPATRALVQDIARNRQIRYLAIADRYGAVIASTRTDEVGGKLPDLAGLRHLSHAGEVDSYRSPEEGRSPMDGMLLFNLPIHYQTATVGELRLGISNAPLRSAQRTTLWVIATVLVLTLIAVVGAAYVLFRRLLAPLELLGDALLRIGRGDFHYRIRLVRRDELGRLFASFNLMAGALQMRRRRPGKVAPPPPNTAVPVQPTLILSPPSRRGDGSSKPD